MTEDEVLALFETCSNTGRWGADDQLGTLNLITADRRIAALRSVRAGRVVSLGHELPIGRSRQHPPAAELVPRYSPVDALDELTVRIHGYEVTHVDALGHVFFDGRAWGGRRREDAARDDGLAEGSVAALAGQAIVTRGVLLDVAAVRGVPYLEPGDAIGVDDLAAAEQRADTVVGPGDAIVVRSGHGIRAQQEGDGHDEAAPHAGVSPEVLPWLHDRGVAVYSGDCIERRPSGYARVTMPLHQVGLVAMGLCILDCLDVEALATACREEGRSTFVLVVAPLRIPGGTGSAVNPLALF
jgi:kynurenine formamidase